MDMSNDVQTTASSGRSQPRINGDIVIGDVGSGRKSVSSSIDSCSLYMDESLEYELIRVLDVSPLAFEYFLMDVQVS